MRKLAPLVVGIASIVVVAAISFGFGTPPFTVVELSSTDGSELWRENSRIGRPFTVVADALGDVIAGGDADAPIVKLHGTDGSDFESAVELSASPAATPPGDLV